MVTGHEAKGYKAQVEWKKNENKQEKKRQWDSDKIEPRT